MLEIRREVVVSEVTHIEGGRALASPIKTVCSMAIIANPWYGKGFVEDLKPEIYANAPELADLVVGNLLGAVPANSVEAYGKAAVVGLGGELEHASAFIHTLRFGNRFRDAVSGTSILSFTNKRGGSGTPITVPMVHKTEDWRRTHFITFETAIMDAPASDEIVVAIAVATGGRPHPRIGDRHQDMGEMGLEK